MEITSEELDGVRIVAVSGQVDAITSTRLEEALMGYIDKGATKMVLDMRDLLQVTSAGLRVILFVAQQLHGKGGFALAHPREEVLEILEMAGFDTILSIYSSLEEAKNGVESR